MAAKIVDEHLTVDNVKKECPFSVIQIKTNSGITTIRASCGTWCALFQHKKFDLNDTCIKDTVYLNCGSGSSYDLTEVDTENKNIGGS